MVIQYRLYKKNGHSALYKSYYFQYERNVTTYPVIKTYRIIFKKTTINYL